MKTHILHFCAHICTSPHPACSGLTCLSRRGIQGTDPMCPQAIPQDPHRHPPGPASPGHTLISHCCEAAQGSLKPHDCQHVHQPWAPGGFLRMLLKLPTLAADLEDPRVPKSRWTKQRFSLLYLCGSCLKMAETNLIKTLEKGALQICA